MGRKVSIDVTIDLSDIDTSDLEDELEDRGFLVVEDSYRDDMEVMPVGGGPVSHWSNERLWETVYLQAIKVPPSEELRELIQRNTGRIV